MPNLQETPQGREVAIFPIWGFFNYDPNLNTRRPQLSVFRGGRHVLAICTTSTFLAFWAKDRTCDLELGTTTRYHPSY